MRAIPTWRLPSLKEMVSLVDYGRHTLALPAGHPFPFSGVQSYFYWSGTSCASNTDYAWFVDMFYGFVSRYNKTYPIHVWPVRGGQ